MSETSEKTDKLIKFIFEKYQMNELDNESLVQVIELCGSFLNLKTISKYSKENNISYNGAKNFRKIIKLFDVKFVIDND